MHLKIMTFNLRLNVKSDGENAWPNRVKAVAEAIKRHDADIVGIQEGLLSMIRDLEPLLPEYAWVGEGREGGEKGEYSAILYKKDKWRAEEVGGFGLSETPEKLGAMSWDTACPRMCTWARFKSADGEEFAAFNTHLDHISDEAQTKGMELIRERIERFRERTGLPAVLTGDFNVGPEHAVVSGLERAGYRNAYSALEEGSRSVGRTFHEFLGGEPGEPIDYVFASPDLQIRSVEIDRGQYDGHYPSDHYPIVAEVAKG